MKAVGGSGQGTHSKHYPIDRCPGLSPTYLSPEETVVENDWDAVPVCPSRVRVHAP